MNRVDLLFIVDNNIFINDTLIKIEDLDSKYQMEFKVFVYPNILSQAMMKIVIPRCNIVGLYSMEDCLKGYKDLVCKLNMYTFYYDGKIHMISPVDNCESICKVGSFHTIRSKFHWRIYAYLVQKHLFYVFICIILTSLYVVYNNWLYGVDLDRKLMWLNKWQNK